MQFSLGSTRALACSDRRPRLSACGPTHALNGGQSRARLCSARARNTTRVGACAPRFKLLPRGHSLCDHVNDAFLSPTTPLTKVRFQFAQTIKALRGLFYTVVLVSKLAGADGLQTQSFTSGTNSRARNTNDALAAALAEIAKPSKALPFTAVIQATTGKRVLDFDTNNPAHVELRQKIIQAAALAGERARKEGLSTVRANEAGNHMEPFVRAALKDLGLATRVPITAAGQAQVAGYPDIEILGLVPSYLELKTYNAATANTTQRSFYYSPSAQPKVTRDALHLLLAYELDKKVRDGKTIFVPVRWRLISLQDLQVDLKFEFNQSNRGLYGNSRAVLDGGVVR